MVEIQLQIPEQPVLLQKAVSLNCQARPRPQLDQEPLLLPKRRSLNYAPAEKAADAPAGDKIAIAVPRIAVKLNNLIRPAPAVAAVPQQAAEEAEAAQVVMINTGLPNDAELDYKFCGHQMTCGHPCLGVKGEKKHLPCMKNSCADKNGYKGYDEDELCHICYTSELGAEPSIRLSCGHAFHIGCVVQLLKAKWSTLRITWGFLGCPECKHEIDIFSCRPIAELLGPLISIKKFIEKDCLVQAERQGLLNDERLSTPGDVFYQKPREFALQRCSYYQCHDCKKPYFGGLIDCEQEVAAMEKKETKPEDLFCQDCLLKQIGAGQTTCEKHGTIQIDWKCMYCCSTALYCCFGTHYMCFDCHEEYNRTLDPPLKDCHGINCPLGIAHPPPSKDPFKGGVFPLGCGICRSEKLSILQQRDVRQVVDADNLPEFWNKKADPKKPKIVRPKVEIEMPEFVWRAEEIQAEIEEEAYQRWLKQPVILKPAKKQRVRKQGFALPDWFVNPEGQEEDAFFANHAQAQAQTEAINPAKVKEPKRLAELKQMALKVICNAQNKRARVHRRRR